MLSMDGNMNYSNMNFTNVNTTKKIPFPEIPLGKFIGISVAVFAVIGVVANLLVLVVLSMSQRKRFTPYRYLISHLAISDFCCSVFLLAYAPLELNSHNWIYDKRMCKLIYPMITFSTNLAIGTILVISVERYRGVILPHRVAWKPRNVWIALIVVWLTGLGITIPNIVVIKVTTYSNIDYCNESWDSDSWRKIYGISFFFCAFVLPLTAIIVMHVQIMIRLARRDLRPADCNYQQKNDARITRVLTAIIFAFFICILPNKLLYFVWDLYPELEKNMESKVRYNLRTIQLLYYARVAIDPLLYCFFDTRFKKDFKNSVKMLHGESFIDSETMRSRARSTTRSRAPTVLSEERSRAGTFMNGEVSPAESQVDNFNIVLASKLNTLHETELKTRALDIMNDYMQEERSRSNSSYTEYSLYGSASPLVKCTLSTESRTKPT